MTEISFKDLGTRRFVKLMADAFREMKGGSTSTTTNANAKAVCKLCGCNNPRFGDFDHCSRTCHHLSEQAQKGVCERLGCKNPRSGKHNHCSKTCARLSERPDAPACARPGCLSTVYVPTKSKSKGKGKMHFDYCSSACFHKHSDEVNQTTLCFLDKDNRDFNLVKYMVAGQLALLKVARIVYSKTLAKRHLDLGVDINNVNLKFHGTVLGCSSLYAAGQMCGRGGCRVCGILAYGMLQRCVVRGPGLYVAPQANISHGYTVPSPDGIRCMFLCNVFEAKEMSQAITNYADERLILPRYVVFY
ncbi:hypothetical protein BGZ59_005594 [Podila verticillata]|nr:hypothetical protein BGZ59_005594 [Podila verticillata]